MKTFVRTAALSLLLAGCALPALAQSASDAVFRATTLDISASGDVRVTPDMATITLGVNTQGSTAAAALQANATQMTKMVAALKQAGIADKDVQTSNLSLNAQYDYPQNQPPHLNGYQASNQVSIVVHDLKKVGSAVDATVNAGANQVNGIGFGLEDSTGAENAARMAAMKALTAKANLYAAAAGYKVARLVSLNEGGGYSPRPPMPMAMMARMEKADSTPVAAGELDVRIEVHGVYELTR